MTPFFKEDDFREPDGDLLFASLLGVIGRANQLVAPLVQKAEAYDDLWRRYQPLEKDKLDAQREKHLLREENEKLRTEIESHIRLNKTLMAQLKPTKGNDAPDVR